ncbi:hypothetical protein C0J52_18011 [Blattella germanica]|nr:hypothetical protein C0J52_18011 [Blattella germanica]
MTRVFLAGGKCGQVDFILKVRMENLVCPRIRFSIFITGSVCWQVAEDESGNFWDKMKHVVT